MKGRQTHVPPDGAQPGKFAPVIRGICATARCETRVRSLRFDFRRADQLPPLFSERDNEAVELSRRTGKRLQAEIGYPRGQFWIGEASIQFGVEPIDNRCRRAHGRANSLVAACLIAGNEFSDSRNFRENGCALCGGHA